MGLLLAAVLVAQAPAGSVPDVIGVRYEQSSLTGSTADSASVRPDWSSSTKATLTQAGVGLGCGAVVAGAGLATVMTVSHGSGAFFGAVGMAVLTPVASATGVVLAGGGKGRAGRAYLGSCAGAALFGLIGFAGQVPGAAAGLVLGSCAGAVVGYNLNRITVAQAAWGTIALEAGAGLGTGLALGFGMGIVGGGIGFLIERPRYFGDPPGAVALVGMGVGGLAGVSLGTTIGTCAVGRACHQGGQRMPTLWGALAGTVAGAPLAWFGGMKSPPLAVLGAVLPATGAVIGYNLSRPEPATQGSFLHRLDPPALSLRPDAAGGQRTVALDIRVLTARF